MICCSLLRGLEGHMMGTCSMQTPDRPDESRSRSCDGTSISEHRPRRGVGPNPWLDIIALEASRQQIATDIRQRQATT